MKTPGRSPHRETDTHSTPMKHILSIFAILSALFLFCGTTRADAQAETQAVNIKEETRKATNYLKKLKREEREAALAEMAGLLYMEDGSNAYTKEKGRDKVEVKVGKKVVEKVSVPHRRVKQGALFVGSDGRVYNFYAALPQSSTNPHKRETWKLAKLYMYRAGKQAVSARFADNLAEMEVRRGIHFLQQMSPELRQALFAEALNLLFMDDGKSGYTGRTLHSTINGERVPFQEPRSGARFMDAQGVKRGFSQVRDEANKHGKAWHTWWPGVKLHMHHVGQEKILAPFAEEIQSMHKHAASRK